MAFVKLHTKLLDSSLWLDRDARDIFITALLMAQPVTLDEPSDAIHCRKLAPLGFTVPPGNYGFVPAAGPAIVRRAMVDDQEIGVAALERLSQPEADSRSEEHEGRRLVRINGGYLVLNYEKYRKKDETAGERMRRWRAKQNAVTGDGDAVTTRNVTHAEGEADVEADAETAATTSPVDNLGEDESTRAHRESTRRREAIERAELQRRAATIPMRDPLAAVHDPDTVAIVATSPPAGSRAWGPSDAAEVHRQLSARGLAHVEAVVAFIRDSIEGRRRFPGRGGEFVPAEPRQWSVVWQHDGEPWTRWEQRYAEASASLTAPAARQGEQPSESETDPEPDPPDEELTDEARGRMAAMAQGLVDKLSGAKSVTDASDVEARETDDAT